MTNCYENCQADCCVMLFVPLRTYWVGPKTDKRNFGWTFTSCLW